MNLLAITVLIGLTHPIAALSAPSGQVTEPVKKVLILGVDGLRPDALLAADTPSFDDLRSVGCFSAEARTDRHTVSGPCWSSMLTGVWSSRHGVTDNSFEGSRFTVYPHFFTRIKQARPELTTASFVTWMPLELHLVDPRSTDLLFAHDYEVGGTETLLEEAARVLEHEDPDVTFFYFAEVDTAGHNHGFHPSSPEYIAEIERTDVRIGRLLRAIARRPTIEREDWLILLSSDHGGTLDGSHGRDEPRHRQVPYLASGPAAARGTIEPVPNVVDIAVTAMTHLGVPIDPSWGLDGRPSGLRAPIQIGANLIDNGDAEASTGAHDRRIDLGVPGWVDTGRMTVLEYGRTAGAPAWQSPGPDDRGRNFFSGSGERDCMMSQTISVREIAKLIDESGVQFDLSGFFGGSGEERDCASLRAEFLGQRQGHLGTVLLRPVTLADRRAVFATSGPALTGMLERRAHGILPRGTRTIRLTLEAEAAGEANDGCADNLSLVLRPVARASGASEP